MKDRIRNTLKNRLQSLPAVSIANNAYDRLFRADRLIQSDSTPHKALYSDGLMQIRYYPPLDDWQIPLGDDKYLTVEPNDKAVPLVIVPPLAASSLVFDLMPKRSLVRYFLAKGYSVYLIDWGEPTHEHAHLRIKDYAVDMMGDALEKIREHADQDQISLMGWCMGGMFNLIHAALTQDPNIKNLITIASPIDSRQGGVGGGIISAFRKPAELISQYTNFRIHNVDPRYLQIPGRMNAIAFKLTNPIGSLASYWDLIINLWDRDFLKSHTTTASVLDNMLDYPGGIIQDFAVKFALNNDLSEGQMHIGGQHVDFANIHSALLAFAGDSDALVTPDAARKSLTMVSSEDTEFVTAPGGHAGVIMGTKAPEHVWKVAADWLSTRSDTE